MKITTFYKNKTLNKWLKYNCITLVLGISIILNVIYLPKYFNGQTNHQDQITTIKIKTIDNKTKCSILNDITCITTFKTLGNLFGSCPNIFETKSMNIGRFLNGVKSNDDTWIEANNTRFWQIECWNGTSFSAVPKGIDDTLVQNNDIYQLDLTPL